jgi:hypothetical protein
MSKLGQRFFEKPRTGQHGLYIVFTHMHVVDEDLVEMRGKPMEWL